MKIQFHAIRSDMDMSSRRQLGNLTLVQNQVRKALLSTSGSQLLEFALALPFLLVLVIGIIDFGGAFNLKQNMTNAAREGARIVVSNTLTDTSCTDSTPCSMEAAADAVKQYLNNAGVTGASCISPTGPTSSGTLIWTYSCSGITLTINRGYVFTSTGGQALSATQVSLSCPYTWNLNRIMGLLVKGGSFSGPATLTTSAVMQNLTVS